MWMLLGKLRWLRRAFSTSEQSLRELDLLSQVLRNRGANIFHHPRDQSGHLGTLASGASTARTHGEPPCMAIGQVTAEVALRLELAANWRKYAALQWQ